MLNTDGSGSVAATLEIDSSSLRDSPTQSEKDPCRRLLAGADAPKGATLKASTHDQVCSFEFKKGFSDSSRLAPALEDVTDAALHLATLGVSSPTLAIDSNATLTRRSQGGWEFTLSMDSTCRVFSGLLPALTPRTKTLDTAGANDVLDLTWRVRLPGRADQSNADSSSHGFFVWVFDADSLTKFCKLPHPTLQATTTPAAEPLSLGLPTTIISAVVLGGVLFFVYRTKRRTRSI